MRARYHRLLVCVVVMLSVAIGYAPLQAQNDDASLELTKTIEGNLTEIESGEFFTYVIQYRCVGITLDCRNVTLTDQLPPELSWAQEDVRLFDTVHTVGANYDETTGTVTWDFIDPLPAGSTGELRLRVRFPPGTTLDGEIAINEATVTSDNPNDPGNPNTETSNPVPIEAIASNQLRPEKTLISGGTIDNEATYRVSLCRPSNDREGVLNMENVTMIDTLPPGVTFVNASGGGVYDAGPPQTVVWNLPDYDVAGPRCISRTVTVRFDSGNGFNIGDTTTNNLTITGTPLGEPPVTSDITYDHVIGTPTPGVTFFKLGSRDQVRPGDEIYYGMWLNNDGSVPLETAIVTDPIADQLEVLEIRTGSAVSPAFPITIRYQTNLDGTFRDVPGSPFTTQQTVLPGALGLGAGEYITVLQWDFSASTLPIGFQTSRPLDTRFGFLARVLNVDRGGNAVVPGQVIENEGTIDYGTPGNILTETEDHDVQVVDVNARPELIKSSPDNGASVNPGDILTYTIQLTNEVDALIPLSNPVIADLLDEDVIFLDWTFDPGNTANRPPAAVAPIFERIDNFNGTGRTLVRWRFEGTSAYDLLVNESLSITYRAEVRSTAIPDAESLRNTAFIVDWNENTTPNVNCATVTDNNDLDGDGNTAEEICTSNDVIVGVNSQAVMESAKWVRGELDTDWVRFPDVGLTSPNGPFDFRLELFNAGNVPMRDIVIVEILPHLGDRGVIDRQPRETQWVPELIAEVFVSTGGVTVSYSTETNPCRPTVVPSGPVGCANPNWNTTPPADLSTVQSIRFELCCTIDPGERFEIIIPMRAPDNAQPGDTAWNSFGFIATRDDIGTSLLATEPFKVGITTFARSLEGVKTLIAVNDNDTTFTYELVWLNNGNNFPVDAQIFDALPPEVEFMPGSLECEARGTSITQACRYDAVQNRIVWEGQVGPDAGATGRDDANNEIVIRFRTRMTTTVDSITNEASSIIDADLDGDFTDELVEVAVSNSNPVVWTRGEDINFNGDAQTTRQAIQAALASVQLTKNVSPPFVLPGENATWTITVNNTSDVPMPDVIITDSVPAGLTILSASSTSGTVTVNGNLVTFRQDVLPPGTSVTITVQTRYDSANNSQFVITNNAIMSVNGEVVRSTSASFLQITSLPQTGESPHSTTRATLMMMSMFVLGLAGLRVGLGAIRQYENRT